MTEQEFWSIIKKSRSSECEEQGRRIVNYLVKMQPTEIIDFERNFRTQLIRAYSWDLWAISYIINGGSSDDGFEYFRAWLIAKGQASFEDAITDPVKAARGFQPGDIAECEDVLNASWIAYKTLTGQEMPATDIPQHPAEPLGEPWEEDDLPELYPALYDKFS